MKLNDLADLEMGLNSTKFRNVSKDEIYKATDINHDLEIGYVGIPNEENENKVIAGDLVIHLMTKQATVVSLDNSGKYFPQQLVKLKIDRTRVNPWYLCYVINESTSIKHQLYQYGAFTKSLPTKIIKGIEIDLPSIEEQESIGEIYRRTICESAMQIKYAQQMKDASLEILRKQDVNN